MMKNLSKICGFIELQKDFNNEFGTKIIDENKNDVVSYDHHQAINHHTRKLTDLNYVSNSVLMFMFSP